ncbi:SDR family oxidoreductase [Neorhizobium alkalisoli]|uniref:Nucleoside-diphosphate-sugar epimerase n=1 Tax=Neorhizobium alkalisoli TaxID=528178 RepID=A0A561QRK2_9HYPH|nr:SDR family oxidoreductase [Neorhizobium alkalisoli]TWF53010.1 nucleoside-diphosphate-sugar epimerase [Neorhizobium alkalisoli]
MRVMIFGCGYSGMAIAKAFQAAGADVAGTARSTEKTDIISAAGIVPFLFDGSAFAGDILSWMGSVTHLIQSIPPGREGDPLLKLVTGRLAALFPKLEWIGYLSTVGVYGDHGGGWVTEETPGSPILGRSIERVDTEEAWTAEAATAGVPVAALRLSGIYGPGRNAFVNLSRGTARRIIKKDQVFNRIRVEDIGGAALFLGTARIGGIYNVTDDEPGPPQDVIVEAARLMGVEPPPELDFDTAEMTPMARSFYGANKRVSNARIRAAGFQFRFPNYRMSLAEMWDSGRWKG